METLIGASIRGWSSGFADLVSGRDVARWQEWATLRYAPGMYAARVVADDERVIASWPCLVWDDVPLPPPPPATGGLPTLAGSVKAPATSTALGSWRGALMVLTDRQLVVSQDDSAGACRVMVVARDAMTSVAQRGFAAAWGDGLSTGEGFELRMGGPRGSESRLAFRSVITPVAGSLAGLLQRAGVPLADAASRMPSEGGRPAVATVPASPPPPQPSAPPPVARPTVPVTTLAPSEALAPPASGLTDDDTVDAASEQTGAPTLYDTLGLDRSAPTDALAKVLRAQLEPAWRVKAERGGRTGDRAGAMVAHVTEAQRVFASDATRAAYDAAHPATDGVPVEGVWLAWGFLFQERWEQALEAAHRACTESPDDPMAHVARAWAELAGGNIQAASLVADQAYAAGRHGGDLADIHHVRGAILIALGRYAEASDSLTVAIERALPRELPELLFRKAQAEEGRGATGPLIAACVRALATEPGPAPTLRTWLERAAMRAFRTKCHREGAPAESAARYAETRQGWLMSAVSEPSRSRLVDYFDQEINNEQRLAATVALAQDAASFRPERPV